MALNLTSFLGCDLIRSSLFSLLVLGISVADRALDSAADLQSTYCNTNTLGCGDIIIIGSDTAISYLQIQDKALDRTSRHRSRLPSHQIP